MVERANEAAKEEKVAGLCPGDLNRRFVEEVTCSFYSLTDCSDIVLML